MTTKAGHRHYREPMAALTPAKLKQLTEAARDKRPVSGLTHCFYRYPARFSPAFAAMAIQCFSKPGDVVLDPYMGGGTTLVEALVAGRHAIGNDLNSLASFVAKVKTTPLRAREISAIRHWAECIVPTLNYRSGGEGLTQHVDASKMRNLNLTRARFIRKLIALALESITQLPTANARSFVKCIILRVAQWALDGKRSHTSLEAFRQQATNDAAMMLDGLEAFTAQRRDQPGRVKITNADAADLATLPAFKDGTRADLVVTSPPYPGVHLLYHRWQVDGRRETPAPYWITGTSDGQGASYYNFGDRHDPEATDYFNASLRSLMAIRQVMHRGAFFVQMVSFGNPKKFLPRYLDNMAQAGFAELRHLRTRIWREVPNRRWHATSKGPISSSREVVLLHKAI